MSIQYKNFDVAIGQEEQVSKEISAFYNRQGRIGNTVNNAKLIVKNNGSLTIVVSTDGKIDDGRQIDDIEDRKTVEIIRVAPGSGDEEKVAAFTNTHNELGDALARPFMTAAGDDTVYFLVATKARTVSSWDGDDDSYYDSSSSHTDRADIDAPATDIKADAWMDEDLAPAQAQAPAPAGEKVVEEVTENVLDETPVTHSLPGLPTVAEATDAKDDAQAAKPEANDLSQNDPEADALGTIFG